MDPRRTTIGADVKRFAHQINTDEVFDSELDGRAVRHLVGCNAPEMSRSKALSAIDVIEVA
jgi:hypothetical protein